MKKNKTQVLRFLGLFATLLLTPFVTFALTFQVIVYRLLSLIQLIIPLLLAVGVLGFFFGVVRYIFSAGNPDARAEGAKYMIYGIVALFVMVSVWGLVAILQHTIFGSGFYAAPSTIPQI
jgi:hypothetical protein